MIQFYSENNRDLLKKIAERNHQSIKGHELNDKDVVAEYVIEKQERNDFHLERGGQAANIKSLVCRICGCDHFIVGQDAYFTALKCTSCGYELGIHEG